MKDRLQAPRSFHWLYSATLAALPLILLIVLFEIIGGLFSVLSGNIKKITWYEKLKERLSKKKNGIEIISKLPNALFGIVWTILYAGLAIVAYFIWLHAPSWPNHKNKIWMFLILGLILNWIWSPIFFRFKWFCLALLLILLIIVLNVLLMNELYQASKTTQSGASAVKWMIAILVIYSMWLCFAFYLNYVVILETH